MSRAISTCRGCGKRILWMKTITGKLMPVDYDASIAGEKQFNPKTMTSHFATCPSADKFRR